MRNELRGQQFEHSSPEVELILNRVAELTKGVANIAGAVNFSPEKEGRTPLGLIKNSEAVVSSAEPQSPPDLRLIKNPEPVVIEQEPLPPAEQPVFTVLGDQLQTAPTAAPVENQDLIVEPGSDGLSEELSRGNRLEAINSNLQQIYQQQEIQQQEIEQERSVTQERPAA